jgi:hypothetical protein
VTPRSTAPGVYALGLRGPMVGHGFAPADDRGVTSAACTCGWSTVHGYSGDTRFVDAQVRRDWDVHCGVVPPGSQPEYTRVAHDCETMCEPKDKE